MSEAMAIETLTMEWLGSRLNTMTKKARARVCVDKGYSDIDALAASLDSANHPATLALAECKVQGRPLMVFHYSSAWKVLGDSYTNALLKSARNLFSADNTWWSPPLQMGPAAAPWSRLKTLELWLIANVHIDPADQAAVDARFTNEIRAAGISGLPQGVTVRAHIRSTLDVILEMYDQVEKWVNQYHWGPRSGHPQLDILRELVRYRHPSVRYGSDDDCREQSLEKIHKRFPCPGNDEE